LAAADADGGFSPGKHDRVRFDVLAGFPGKLECGQLLRGWLPAGHDLPSSAGRVAQVYILAQKASHD